MGTEAHDWGNLLTMTNLLAYDHTFGLLAHYSGMILMLASILWGGYICLTTWKLRDNTPLS